jgi:RNA 2',3'-cyclic 3'-phosphodiesterase
VNDAAGGAGEGAGGTGERARLFVALELPAEARTAVQEWRSAQLARVDGLRLVESEALHVTLCFLGSQPVGQIDSIARACAEMAAGSGRPALALGDPIWLPRRRPRVVAIGVEDRERTLAEIQLRLARVLAAGGWYEPERRGFRPHVTVARAARSARPRALEPVVPVALRFLGDEVTLMRSRTGAGGARYERLASVTLAG